MGFYIEAEKALPLQKLKTMPVGIFAENLRVCPDCNGNGSKQKRRKAGNRNNIVFELFGPSHSENNFLRIWFVDKR